MQKMEEKEKEHDCWSYSVLEGRRREIATNKLYLDSAGKPIICKGKK